MRDLGISYAKLQNVELRKATLRGIDAQYAHFELVRFDGADGKEANFSHAKFEKVVWHGALLRGARFEHALMDVGDLASAEEVDIEALGAAERAQTAQRAEDLKAMERQRSMIFELQHALTMREEKISKSQEKIDNFRKLIAREESGIRIRASILRIIAACWLALLAMLVILITNYLNGLHFEMQITMELKVIAGVAALITFLNLLSAMITYNTSRQLWRVIEEKEQNHDD